MASPARYLEKQPAAVEVNFGSGSLASKLDVLGAAIAAVREAHRDQMSPTCWASLNRAQEAIAEAMLAPHPPGIDFGKLMIEVGMPEAGARRALKG